MSSMETGVPKMERFVGPPDDPDRFRLVKPLDVRGDVHVHLAVGPDGPVTIRRYVGDEDTVRVEERWNRQQMALNRVHHEEPGAGIVRIKDVFRGSPDHPRATAKPEGPWVLYAVVSWHEGVLAHLAFDGPVHDGAGLEDRLRRLQPVVLALDTLSSLGLRHGDVKPANIVLVGDDQSVLLDPGSIAEVDEPVREATPAYGHGVQFVDIDLYGLAGTAFWCATRQSPPTSEGHLVDRLRQVGLPQSVVLLMQQARNGSANAVLAASAAPGRSLVSTWFDRVIEACADTVVVDSGLSADVPTQAVTETLAESAPNADPARPSRSGARSSSLPTESVDPDPITTLGLRLADERTFRTWKRRARLGGFMVGAVAASVAVVGIT